MSDALIIAHGSPADPLPQERWMQALAARVRMWLPGWRITGTTLALPGALEAAVARQPQALIYPFFMAEGFFTRRQLPKRLEAAGMLTPRQLPAFGHHPALPALLAQVVTAQPGTVLLAAHGSQVSRASATQTEALADDLRAQTGRTVLAGYVEEAPFLQDVARVEGPAFCLPLFATRAGHVAQDVPEALETAGFQGTLLPAIGEHAEAARLIAEALRAA
ncbi:MAG TPA: CbiX/SirB N-terminal domain-containing protein [Gemmobacter sp.]|nr:CbiX/SirB N-terminal domain-containing protein [Gemmobacter sp.]